MKNIINLVHTHDITLRSKYAITNIFNEMMQQQLKDYYVKKIELSSCFDRCGCVTKTSLMIIYEITVCSNSLNLSKIDHKIDYCEAILYRNESFKIETVPKV